MSKNNTDVITDPEEAANVARINTQCFLIENMDRIRKSTTPIQNLILTDQEIPASDVVGLLNRGNDAEIFLTATPAQLAYLVPKIQLYIPRDEEDGKDELIYFGDYYLSPTSANTGEKPVEYDPNFLETTNIIFKESGRGRGAGISSFSYALDNKHPGTISFMANLEIKFASLRDLAEGPYVALISPTARKLASKDKPDSELEMLKQERRKLEFQRRNRYAKNKKSKPPRGVLSSGASKLKAVIGWQTPTFKDESLIPNGDKKFYESVKANEIALLLHLTKYKLTFGEAGEATLTIDYAASIEADFSGPGSSVFPDDDVNDFKVAVRTKDLQGLQDVKITKDGAGIINNFGHGSTISRRLLGTPPGSAITLEQEDEKPMWLLDGFSTPDEVLKVPRSISLDMSAVREDLELFELDLKIEQVSENRPQRIEMIQKYITNTKQALTLVADRTRSTKYRSFIDKLTGSSTQDSKIEMLIIENRFLGKEAKGKVLPPGAVRNRRMGKDPTFYVPDTRTNSLGAIGAVINAEKGAKRDEAVKKVRVGKKLNPAARTDTDVTKSESGKTRIGFMRFGDILNVALDNIQEYTNNKTVKQKIILGTVAIPVTKKLVPERWRYINIADIPVSVEAFQLFFIDRIVGPQKLVYPLRLFVSDMLKYLIEPALNQCKLNPEDGGVSFESTIITTPVNMSKGTILKLSSPIFSNLADRGWNTLIEAEQAQEYLVVYSEDKKSGPGDPRKDREKGTYHLVIGSDRGLVKSISFSSNDNPHLQTQNIVNAAGGGGQLGVLAMPQDASVTMIGNNLFKTGQSVYINAEYALGRERARELLLGGYYIITKVSNTISAAGFQTTLDCRWTNFPLSKKAGER